MAEDFNASMRGAYDLSSLRQSASNQDAVVSESTQQSVIKVPSLIVDLTEANLRSFLNISQSVVLLVDFYSPTSELSRALSEKLTNLIGALDSKALLCRINLDEQARLAEAFNVTESATLMAVMKGQPIALGQGDQEPEKLGAVLEKLMSVAAQNGINGRVEVDAAAQQIDPTPKLPPAHQNAMALLNAGDYEEAKSAYQAILVNSPADSMAIAGLAQAELLLRLKGVDVDKLLNTPPQNFDELFLAADALIAVGDYADGFNALLTNYQDADTATQQRIRERLLSLFEIVGKSSAEVVAARAKLTSLLF